MKKIISLVVCCLVAVCCLVGCGKKEYLGTYEYDHCNVPCVEETYKEIVEDVADSTFEGGVWVIEDNGVAYFGYGIADAEHSYVVNEENGVTNIVMTDIEKEFGNCYYENGYLIMKIDISDMNEVLDKDYLDYEYIYFKKRDK